MIWFGAPEGRKVGSLKRRVRSQLARWEMKNCTPLWGEAHFEVKMLKTQGVRITFGGSHVAWLRFASPHYTTLHYTPLHYTTLQHTTFHYTTFHYTSLHYTTTTITQLRSATLNYTTLYYITLHYITFHYTPLHYITRHYITLNDTEPQIDR